MKSRADNEEKVLIYDARSGRTEEVSKVRKTDAEWKKILTPEEYRVTRLKGTEKPADGKCELPSEPGIYECVCCGTDLFDVRTKFESGTGWPSFFEPVSSLNVIERADDSWGMRRTETACARCDAHLGHVFDDGPPPAGKRYCINSVSLKFAGALASNPSAKKPEKATFAAGCFWGAEETFRTREGVISTKAGYTGGHFKNPAYEDVCTDKTGHAEAVEVVYDPEKVSYQELLDLFWEMHDPTTVNRQGPDIGSQYRSAIFFHTKEQEEAAKSSKEKLERSGKFKKKIATEIVPASEFYDAEEYHQQYIKKGGAAGCHIPPKG